MNSTTNLNRNNQGSVLMTTLFIAGIVGLSLMAALSMVSSQNHMIRRSQVWNLQIPVVEAGVEDAMAHLNNNCYVDDLNPSGKVSHWYGVDGWTATGPTTYTKSNTLPDGSYYIATIDATDTSNPQVYSEGHAVGTSLLSATPSSMLATIGATVASQPVRTVRIHTSNTGLFANGLAARRSIDMNGNGVATDSFDSSDPAFSTAGQYDPTKRKSNGDIATANGLTNSTWISIGNANIFGHVATAPNGTVTLGPQGVVGDAAWQSSSSGVQPGHVTHDLNVSFPDVKIPFTGGWLTPSSGSITNTAAVTVTITNVTASYPLGQSPVLTNTLTLTTATYPAAGTYLGGVTTNTTSTTTPTVPSAGTYVGAILTNTVTLTSTTYPAPGTYVGTPKQTGKKYSYQSISGYTYNKINGYTWAQVTGYTYFTTQIMTNTTSVTYFNNILGDGAYKVASISGTTYVQGNAKLWVTDSLNLTGITIGPGASLKIYSGAASAAVGGSGVVNQPGTATNFFFYGLPSCTSVSLSGNALFIGCIYAPNASLALNGGGNNRTDFIGAGVFDTVVLNGHFNFHYDEALRKFGPKSGFIITGWEEVPNNAQ